MLTMDYAVVFFTPDKVLAKDQEGRSLRIEVEQATGETNKATQPLRQSGKVHNSFENDEELTIFTF